MADRRFAALAVLAEQPAPTFGRPTPTQVIALELGRPHALPTPSFDDEVGRMDLQQDLELAAPQARVDRVVHQFHYRIGGGAVVGKERRCDRRVDPLANGYSLGHSTWKSIPDGLP